MTTWPMLIIPDAIASTAATSTGLEYSVQFVDPELQQLSQLQEPHNHLVALVVQL